MNYIKRSKGTSCEWATLSGWQEYISWPWGECSLVLGDMQRVKVRDKVMSQINLFHSGRGYYRGNIHISWKYPQNVDIICILLKYQRSVDIIRISWIYLHFVDIIRILWKYPRSVDIIRISWILSVFRGHHWHGTHYKIPSS